MPPCNGANIFVPPVFSQRKTINNYYSTDQLNAKILKFGDKAINLESESEIKMSLKEDEDTICFQRENNNLTMNCRLPKLTIVTGKNPRSNLSISVNDSETKYTSSNAKQTFANNNNNSFLEVIHKDHYNKYNAVEKSVTKLRANSKVYTSDKELNIDADRVTVTTQKGLEIKENDSNGEKVAFIHDNDTLKINPNKQYKQGVEIDPFRIDQCGNVRINEKKFFFDSGSNFVGINNDEPKQQLDVTGSVKASTSVITSKMVSEKDNMFIQSQKKITMDSSHVRLTGDLSVDTIDHAVFNDKVMVLNRSAPDADRSKNFPSFTSDGAGLFVNQNFKNIPNGMDAADWQQAFKWYYRGGLFREIEDDESGQVGTEIVPGHLRSSWVLSGGNFMMQGGASQASFMFSIEDNTLNMYKLTKNEDGTNFVELCGTFG